MKKQLLFLSGPLLLLISLLFISSSELYTTADFVGSEACMGCHPEKYSDWVASGHPYKFTVIENDEAPVYPPEAINFQSQWMDSLGDGSHSWADVAGVIGGYGWKARFVGTDGHLIGTLESSFADSAKGHNQMNFFGGEDHGWVDYHADKVTKYNYGCFKCHTTGGDTAGTWLTGADGLGTFTEGGIGCEGCHGPGGDHIVNFPDDIDRVYEFAHQDNSLGGLEIDGEVQMPDPEGNDVNFLCGTCHNRDYKDPINAGGGFVKHHEQWDEFMATKHGEMGLTCTSCHDPHKRVIWDGDGITKTCESCHPDEAATINHSGNNNCIECHMPFAAKSGAIRGKSGYKADVRSHLFAITADTASMFTLDGAWVRDDTVRMASLSPAYSCLGCHNNDPDDGISEKTLEAAALSAAGMHTPSTSIYEPSELALGIYPNPSSGPTVISFTLASTADVSLSVFNTSGQLVYQLSDVRRPAGAQLIQWNGSSNTGAKMQSGYYFVKLTAGKLSSIQKLIIMK